jgi:hypothetical protein
MINDHIGLLLDDQRSHWAIIYNLCGFSQHRLKFNQTDHGNDLTNNRWTRAFYSNRWLFNLDNNIQLSSELVHQAKEPGADVHV